VRSAAVNFGLFSTSLIFAADDADFTFAPFAICSICPKKATTDASAVLTLSGALLSEACIRRAPLIESTHIDTKSFLANAKLPASAAFLNCEPKVVVLRVCEEFAVIALCNALHITLFGFLPPEKLLMLADAAIPGATSDTRLIITMEIPTCDIRTRVDSCLHGLPGSCDQRNLSFVTTILLLTHSRRMGALVATWDSVPLGYSVSWSRHLGR
jgi:hypothetical protein